MLKKFFFQWKPRSDYEKRKLEIANDYGDISSHFKRARGHASLKVSDEIKKCMIDNELGDIFERETYIVINTFACPVPFQKFPKYLFANDVYEEVACQLSTFDLKFWDSHKRIPRDMKREGIEICGMKLHRSVCRRYVDRSHVMRRKERMHLCFGSRRLKDGTNFCLMKQIRASQVARDFHIKDEGERDDTTDSNKARKDTKGKAKLCKEENQKKHFELKVQDEKENKGDVEANDEHNKEKEKEQEESAQKKAKKLNSKELRKSTQDVLVDNAILKDWEIYHKVEVKVVMGHKMNQNEEKFKKLIEESQILRILTIPRLVHNTTLVKELVYAMNTGDINLGSKYSRLDGNLIQDLFRILSEVQKINLDLEKKWFNLKRKTNVEEVMQEALISVNEKATAKVDLSEVVKGGYRGFVVGILRLLGAIDWKPRSDYEKRKLEIANDYGDISSHFKRARGHASLKVSDEIKKCMIDNELGDIFERETYIVINTFACPVPFQKFPKYLFANDVYEEVACQLSTFDLKFWDSHKRIPRDMKREGIEICGMKLHRSVCRRYVDRSHVMRRKERMHLCFGSRRLKDGTNFCLMKQIRASQVARDFHIKDEGERDDTTDSNKARKDTKGKAKLCKEENQKKHFELKVQDEKENKGDVEANDEHNKEKEKEQEESAQKKAKKLNSKELRKSTQGDLTLQGAKNLSERVSKVVNKKLDDYKTKIRELKATVTWYHELILQQSSKKQESGDVYFQARLRYKQNFDKEKDLAWEKLEKVRALSVFEELKRKRSMALVLEQKKKMDLQNTKLIRSNSEMLIEQDIDRLLMQSTRSQSSLFAFVWPLEVEVDDLKELRDTIHFVRMKIEPIEKISSNSTPLK
eukprot:Gb_25224 [translate_table: standard]